MPLGSVMANLPCSQPDGRFTLFVDPEIETKNFPKNESWAWTNLGLAFVHTLSQKILNRSNMPVKKFQTDSFQLLDWSRMVPSFSRGPNYQRRKFPFDSVRSTRPFLLCFVAPQCAVGEPLTGRILRRGREGADGQHREGLPRPPGCAAGRGGVGLMRRGCSKFTFRLFPRKNNRRKTKGI